MRGSLAIILLLLGAYSWSHEPIFGLGPRTIFKGGVGLENAYERGDREEGIATEVLYGITEDLSFTAVVFNTFKDGTEAFGVRLKYRVWKRDTPGTQDAFSVIVGLRSEVREDRTMGLFGLAVGRESRRWYFFGDIRMSGKLFLDGAVGIRPWLTEYLKPDLVLLSELNWESDGSYRAFFVSPAFFFTYRNVAVKGGVQIPSYRSDEAIRRGVGTRSTLSVEFHF